MLPQTFNQYETSVKLKHRLCSKNTGFDENVIPLKIIETRCVRDFPLCIKPPGFLVGLDVAYFKLLGIHLSLSCFSYNFHFL